MNARKLFFNIGAILFNLMIISAMLIGNLAFPTSAHALGLAITVNTKEDNTRNDGKCSLREAITNADQNNQFYADCTAGFSDDGIFFSDALGTANISLGSALPPVTDHNGLTIYGGNDITVNGNNAFRVFAVFGSGSLTLDSLTVKNGKASTIANIGGGVLITGNGTSLLTIRKCTFLGNRAFGSGGAIFNHWGTLTITDSTFSGNSTLNDGGVISNEGGIVTIHNGSFSGNSSGSRGGVIDNRVDSGFPGGIVTITGSSFIDNTSSADGGAIYNQSGSTVSITNASFVENGSSLGGGVYNLGALTINNSDFSRNSGWYAGAIYNDQGTLSITGSSFSENVADFGAGIFNTNNTDESPLNITSSSFVNNIGDGIFNQNGTVYILDKGKFSGNRDGIYSHSDTGDFNNAKLRVWNSSFTNNTGSGVYNDAAGTNIFTSTFDGNGNSGVYNTHASVVTVDRSTFKLNKANDGGGIYNIDSNLHLFNSTLSENEASAKGGGLYNTGEIFVINTTFSGNSAKYGGGIFNDPPGQLNLYNTILANSTLGGDCQNNLGAVNSNNNLIEASGLNACGLTNGNNGNIIGSDPNLGALADSPAYYPLNNGSLATDTGDDVQCLALGNQSQNGVHRPQGAHCDIGSYEVSMSVFQGQAQKLDQDIQNLVDTDELSADNGKILTSILDTSIQAMDKGDLTSAVQTLNDFIGQVNALIKSEEVKPAQGQLLIDDAQAMIADFE